MSAVRHVVIVGAGIVGLSAAWHLLQKGVAVTVLERGTIDGSASTGNAGLIALGHPPMPQPKLLRRTIRMLLDRTGPLYVRPRIDFELLRWFIAFRRACHPAHFERSMAFLAELGWQARECFESIRRDAGVDGEYRTGGWLEVYRTEEGRRRVWQSCAIEQKLGYRIDEIPGDELRRREPAFRPEVLGAAHHVESAFAHPGRFTLELASAVRARGGVIREGAQVVDFVTGPGGFEAVETSSKERVAGDRLLLAAGAWTTRLARRLGIRVPLQGGKGYHLMVPNPGLSLGSVMSETYVAVTPMAGRLRLAGTVELSGLNLTLRRQRLEMLPYGAGRYLRDIEGFSEDRTALKGRRWPEEWCGLRPCTADGLPVIGPSPKVGGVYLCTGHAMMGFALGPVSGRMSAEEILGEKPAMNLSMVRPDRY